MPFGHKFVFRNLLLSSGRHSDFSFYSVKPNVQTVVHCFFSVDRLPYPVHCLDFNKTILYARERDPRDARKVCAAYLYFVLAKAKTLVRGSGHVHQARRYRRSDDFYLQPC